MKDHAIYVESRLSAVELRRMIKEVLDAEETTVTVYVLPTEDMEMDGEPVIAFAIVSELTGASVVLGVEEPECNVPGGDA